MAGFTETHYDVRGIDTAVLTAGSGSPLVFFHGAGTSGGFDSLLPLAEQHQLIVPQHPGFGASADDPSIASVHDYRRHYLDLFGQLGLERFRLAGQSMGGYLASVFAIDHPERIERLALCCPIGLRVPEHPTTDIFSVPSAELVSYLVADPTVLIGDNPVPPTPDALAAQYREMTSAALLFWDRTYDLALPKWLHRITVPTLLLWGEQDRLVPHEQAGEWGKLIPHAERTVLPGLGHLLFNESDSAATALSRFMA